jgi:hypothetical protein
VQQARAVPGVQASETSDMAQGVGEGHGQRRPIDGRCVHTDEHGALARLRRVSTDNGDGTARAAAYVQRDRSDEERLQPLPVTHADHEEPGAPGRVQQGLDRWALRAAGRDGQSGLDAAGDRESAGQDVVGASHSRTGLAGGIRGGVQDP